VAAELRSWQDELPGHRGEGISEDLAVAGIDGCGRQKEVPQATSPSLVSSPRPLDLRLLGLGSSSTNFLFDCLGQS
jgi:hypothetical protein